MRAEMANRWQPSRLEGVGRACKPGCANGAELATSSFRCNGGDKLAATSANRLSNGGEGDEDIERRLPALAATFILTNPDDRWVFNARRAGSQR